MNTPKYGDKECNICKNSFTPSGPGQKYCKSCSIENRKEYQKKRLHPITERICEHCKKPFMPVKGFQKYCKICQPIAYKLADNARRRVDRYSSSKVCIECGDAFIPVSSQVTCNKCKEIKRNKVDVPMYRHICEVCGKGFEAIGERARICSRACIKEAARLRAIEKRIALEEFQKERKAQKLIPEDETGDNGKHSSCPKNDIQFCTYGGSVLSCKDRLWKTEYSREGKIKVISWMKLPCQPKKEIYE